MDNAAIIDLAQKIDDSFVQGRIYHLNYTVAEKRTEYFYEHNRTLINLFEQHPEDASKPDGKAYTGLLGNFKRNLKYPREMNNFIEYDVDGIGFYTKQYRTWLDADGKPGKEDPSIFSSDGKIMGSFYLHDGQGVLQPAKERPYFPVHHWTEVAYFFGLTPLANRVGSMEKLSLVQKDNMLVITGELWGKEKRRSTLEVIIDQALFKPLQATYTDYDYKEQFNRRQVKRWQYKTYAGLTLPQTVIDESYSADLKFQPHLAESRTFSINEFSTTAKNSKESFAAMLKSNFSIYDEITGAHYLSGNPEEILNKLSK